jgi:hypothetical protein
MTAKTHGQSIGLLAAYDFSAFNTIADVGGGNGHMLRSILTATPTLHGVLFDLPHVIEQASVTASSRLQFHSGNFFEDALPICDAYLMMQILHDWSDQESVQILKAIRSSAQPHSKLLLAEWLLPEESEQNWTLFIDLMMLGYLTGRERTKPEFEKLLEGSGFRLDRVIDIGSNTFLLEATVTED